MRNVLYVKINITHIQTLPIQYKGNRELVRGGDVTNGASCTLRTTKKPLSVHYFVLIKYSRDGWSVREYTPAACVSEDFTCPTTVSS